MITLRRSSERGRGDHGWLRSFHTFSFAEYHDPKHMGVGPLRVINEDTVAPNGGFGTHAHRDMEIISYVLEGRLAHKDSLGHSATIGPGTIQRMSAGTGIQHSEFNPSSTEILHFLQIWIVPDHKGARPRYDEATFELCSEIPVIRALVSGTGAGGTIPIDRDVTLSVAILPSGAGRLAHPLSAGRAAYCHVAKGEVTLSGHALRAGDAATLTAERDVAFEDADDAQVLIFDLPGSESMTRVGTRIDPGRGPSSLLGSAALLAVTAAAALIGHASASAGRIEPAGVSPRDLGALVRRADDILLPEEYRSVRRAGYDYDPPPIPPSEIWPAQ